MGYLHARGIVHTDLRSKNVFLELNNRVVITDFGLFSVAGLTTKSVRPGWLMIPEGWLPYLAPEILRSLTTQQDAPDSSQFTMATDMYAFGYVANACTRSYENGFLLWVRSTNSVKQKKQNTKQYHSKTEPMCSTHQQKEDKILRCLQKDPQKFFRKQPRCVLFGQESAWFW